MPFQSLFVENVNFLLKGLGENHILFALRMFTFF